jgi:hypothetical protein
MVWITRIGREAVEKEEEEVMVFTSTHPHLSLRRVVLCSGNAIVWEPVVISAEDSYYTCTTLYCTQYFYHTLFTFVDVFGTIDSFVARRTRASVRPVDRTCVAYSVGVARIRRARVVQMTQQTCKKHEYFSIRPTVDKKKYPKQMAFTQFVCTRRQDTKKFCFYPRGVCTKCNMK